ncbi:hypothetical protein ROLI_002370 [Roseobacter fucihabitans]|uniref:Integrase n=1 Tax=Roseobacter fucihabitans TaxID=1537242 RepID=A0ABZ2BPJ0_9RHOB|nr:phage integrase N-terminal SAM-like domain-containing protein [Roseobacter litoralis]MBC6963488.1 hypothetical protein [Roseobacter litoralis]
MVFDIPVRNFGPAFQIINLRACKHFASWLGRSPGTVTPDHAKYFQQHLVESRVSICKRTQTMTGVKFLFRVTLRRHDLVAHIFSPTLARLRDQKQKVRELNIPG